MKQVAIIGGGISGMASAILLRNKYKSSINITMYSTNIGGEYDNGGLKYIHSTEDMKFFVNNILNIKDWGIKKINGGILFEGLVRDYPGWLLANDYSVQSPIQTMYWEKTRGTKDGFKSTCMNNPWSTDIQLAIDMDVDLFVKTMTKDSVNSCDNIFIDTIAGNLGSIIEGYDSVIYTIPFEWLARHYGIYHSQLYRELHVHQVKMQPKVWWDYLYIPDQNFSFHRVTKMNDGFQFETNSHNLEGARKSICRFCDDILLHKIGYSNIEDVNIIKGHVKSMEELYGGSVVKDDNVILVGRFATMDSRMTFDKVITDLYRKIERNDI